MRKIKKQGAFTNNRRHLVAVALVLGLQLGATGVAHGAVAQNDLPTGETNQIGIESINRNYSGINNALMTIKQHKEHGIALIDWQSFNIGSKATVNILQHHLSDTLINRVVGNDLSQIYGKLNATGNVVLVNPNGMIFDGAQINVGGFAASTADISLNESGGKITGWGFKQDGITQGNITLNNTILNAGYSKVIANTSLHLPDDFAVDMSALTNKVQLVANGDVQLEKAKIYAGDQIKFSGTKIEGIEAWEMDGNDYYANGDIIIRSDMNADDLGTVTITGTENALIAQNSTSIYYNAAIVDKGTTNDNQVYNIKDYKNASFNVSGITNSGTGSYNYVEKGDVIGSEHSTPYRNAAISTYMLVNNVAQLQDLDREGTGDLNGRYALGRTINATGDRLSYASKLNGSFYNQVKTAEGVRLVGADGSFSKGGSFSFQKILKDGSIFSFTPYKTSTDGSGEGTFKTTDALGVETIHSVTLSYDLARENGGGIGYIDTLSISATYGGDSYTNTYIYDGSTWVLQTGNENLAFTEEQINASYAALTLAHTQFEELSGTGHADDYFTLKNLTNSSFWSSNKGFDPIGSTSTPFTGVFTGNGGVAIYAINNLTINRPTQDDVGLFSVAGGSANITSTNLVNTVIIGRSNVGGIAGQLQGNASINWSSNSASSGDNHEGLTTDTVGIVKSASNEAVVTAIGGIVGKMSGTSTLHGVSNNATIIGQSANGNHTDGNISKVGGLVGSMAGASATELVRITNSSNHGNVYGEKEVGGIAGDMANAKIGSTASSTNKTAATYNNAKIEGNDYVGGIVGKVSGNVQLYNVYNTNEAQTLNTYIANIDANGNVTGGLTAEAVADKVKNYKEDLHGVVKGKNYVGGIVGGMEAGSDNNEINVAYNAGNIKGEEYVGGISGNLVGAYSKIENAYNADNNTVVCEKIVEDTDFNAIKSMATSTLVDEELHPIWDGLATDTANMEKARYLMEYYSFYTVGSSGKTYYYFVSQKMEDDSSRMGARGLFVKKEPGSTSYHNVPLTELERIPLADRFYAIREGFRDANIIGNNYVGGIVGNAEAGSVNKVYNAGTITGGVTNKGALIGSLASSASLNNSFFVSGKDASTGKDFSKVANAVGSGRAGTEVGSGALADVRSGEALKSVMGKTGANSFFKTVEKTDTAGNVYLKKDTLIMSTAVDAYTDAKRSKFESLLTPVAGETKTIYTDGTSYYLVTKTVAGGSATYNSQKLVWDGRSKYVSDGSSPLTMATIDMIANQSANSDAKWIVYGDQTLPLLQAFMQNNDIQREFEYDGTTHNLVTDDVSHVYGRADFYEGAGKNVYTEGFEQLQDASSKYFVDNSSIWSPQHGYKLNSEAAIIVTPKDLQVSIEGTKVYGMHTLEDYYVAVPKYKKQYAVGSTAYTWVPVVDGSGNPTYIYYQVSGIGSSRTITEVTDHSFWTKGGKTYTQNVDGLKDMAKDQSKFVVTVDGFVTEETMNALLGSLETQTGQPFTWQAKSGSGYTVTDVQELGAGSYQLTDGVTDKLKMDPFKAKHANYAINYDATLKVEKAKLYYTLDGYREYGEANSTGYYIYELVGVDTNSNSESVNGLLKSWDKINALGTRSDLIISFGYGSKVNSNGISLNAGAINQNTDVKWADRNTSSLGSYEVTSSSGAKLAGSESSWAKNYDFVFAPAGSINTSKTTGTGTQQATTITGVATSHFTVTPVDVTINVEGQRIYGDLMNATTGAGAFFTENGSLTNGVYNVTSSKTSSAPINWLYKAINSQHAGLVGTDVAYSASITAIYKNSDSFSNVVTGGILGAFNNQLKAVESSDPNKTAADRQINTYTNVGDYLIGGSGTGLNTEKNKPLTVAGLQPTNYVFHDGTHSLKITKRSMNIDIKGSKVYGEATQTTGEAIGIGNITFDNIKAHDQLSDEQLKALLIANQLHDGDTYPYNTGTYLDVGTYTGSKTGIAAAGGTEDLLHITNLSDALKHNYDISFTSTYTVNKHYLSIKITGEKTYGDVTQTTGSGYGFDISGLQNSETIGSLGNGLHEHGTTALHITNKAKDVDGDEAGGPRDIYLDAGLYKGSVAADGTISNQPAYVNNLSALAGNGFKESNYAITQDSSYKVNQKVAQVTTSGSRVYGAGNDTVTYAYDASGLLADDVALFGNADKATVNSTAPTLRVGTYGNTVLGSPAVLTTTLSNTNADKLNKNYALSYADTFTITPASLSISITGGKQYGQATSTSGADYTITINGLQNTDKIGGLNDGSNTGNASISVANNLRDSQGDTDRSLDVDTYTVGGSSQSSNALGIEDLLYINNLDAELLHNYNITTSSSYTVTPAPLFIDIQGQKVYGQGTSTNGADYSVTIGGLLNGELISGLGNGTQVGLGANVLHSGATTIVDGGRLLNVGTYYDTITLNGMELDGGQYRPRNYSITTSSTFTVAPNNNPDIDGARFNGGQHRKRRVLQDIRYLDIVDTGIRIE